MPNQDWTSRSFQAVWHPGTQMKQYASLPIIPIREASGLWLTDFDGNRYLDAISSWWVNLFGHCEPRIKAALTQQLNQLDHIMLAGFTHRPVVELSERLAELTGLGHAFYASDGACATEIALKMSFHYWRNLNKPAKHHFVSLENSYHGETIGALAVTDIPLFSATYAPLLTSAIRAPTPDARQANPDVDSQMVALQAAAGLEKILAAQAHNIAAIIIEPLVQGAAGMAMHDARYLVEVRRLADQYQVHLIADEIAVGFGRTGTLFACEQANIRPDFLCLSKGITGGFLPLSCILTKDNIYKAFYNDRIDYGFLHSHSYTGNALACRAALTVLDIFRDDEVLARNRELTSQFAPMFVPLQQHPAIKHFRHCGMIWAFDVISEHPRFGQAFSQAMLARSCLVRPIGNTVYFMPPYCIQKNDMAHLIEATLSSLESIEKDDENGLPTFSIPQ